MLAEARLKAMEKRKQKEAPQEPDMPQQAQSMAAAAA